MTKDPLKGAWEEPQKLTDWGMACSPPLEQPWLAHISFERTPADVMSVGRLLLPEFIEYRGGIFLKMQFSELDFFRWMEILKELPAVEKMLNHTHVYDIFGHTKNASDEDFLRVATLLQRTWSISLAEVFPSFSFDVVLETSEESYGPVVSFSRLR